MTSTSRGTRRRIITPSPPAPVPRPRATAKPADLPPVEDKSTLRTKKQQAQEQDSDASVVRAGGSMALATLVSRITGFIRTVLITSSLGAAIASAFQTSNQIPNLITEIVLGAVLTSLVVPVLVHAEKEDPDNGESFVRRLFTLSVLILGTVTVGSVIAAPLLTRMMLRVDGQVNVDQATSMAYLLLPQIFFYGLFALFQAVLNTKNVFTPGAWAPVVNNVISITVLLAYWTLPGELNPAANSPVSDPHILLLGLGTTLGVIVQCLLLVPYLKRAGVNLKPLWGIDARLKQFGGMAIAIIAYVAISQAGYVVTSQVASSSSAAAPVIYQNHWLLLQVPYGIIGVTLLTAIMPRLSRNAADGDVEAVVRDLTLGTKLTFIALIPIVVFFTGFGVPIARGLFGYGRLDLDVAQLLGLTLSFSAFTLIPYALVLLHLRVFYAREEAWTPTFIIAGITITKVVLSLAAPTVANSPDRVVVLLGTANGFGFVAGAVIGAFLLKRKLGSLGGRAVMQTTAWSLIASLVGLAVAYAVFEVLPEPQGSALTLAKIAVTGIIFLIVTGLVLSRSKLPEVVNLGKAMQRIPGMARFIKVESKVGIEVGDMQEIQPQFALDAFTSSPVPPPMSAGIVRGPSLVPGAPVSDGRFRLLKDHGSMSGARFWQAREQDTGRMVALTFVDTANEAPLAPATPREVAQRSSEVSRSTRKLRDLHLASVAPGIEILSYRAGCLVVADWVDGSDLQSVTAEGDLDPNAVAHALAPILEDSATAHNQGLVMGIENHNQLRVSTAGIITLAFPAVLNDATAETDTNSLRSAINLIVNATDTPPKRLRDLAVADSLPVAVIASDLRNFAPDTTEALPVEKPAEPEIEQQPTAGFGGRSYSGGAIIALGALATAFVVVMAALTAWVMSLIGTNETAPVDSQSIRVTTTAKPNRPPIILPLRGATSPLLIDGDKGTSWSTTTASDLTVEFAPANLKYFLVSHTKSTGTAYVIYGQNEIGRMELASGKLTSGKDNIELKETNEKFTSLVFHVETLPKSGKLSINDVEVVGSP